MLSIEVDGKYYIFDAGPLADRILLRAGIRPESIKSIFITHVHGDHIFGLPSIAILFYSMGYRVKKGIKVYVPFWMCDEIDKLFTFGGRSERVILDIICFSEVVGDKPLYNDESASIYAILTEHAVSSVAYKIIVRDRAHTFTIVYTGDTRPCNRLIEFSKGCDVLIHEASYDEGFEDIAMKSGHSTVKQAINDALRAGAKILVLYHLGFQKFKHKQFYVNKLKVIVPDDMESLEL